MHIKDIESHFVAPFYLDMMGFNCLGLTAEVEADVISAGRRIASSDVARMLRAGHWRPVIMGAWYSLAVSAESIQHELLRAMAQSRGSLTAPPLAAAATVVAGPAAVPAMVDYIGTVMASDWRDGSEGVVAAAVEHLDGVPPLIPSDQDRRSFRAIREFAMRLNGDWRVR
ncbi:hypothetical protein [Actinoplanes sp. HUAS TT8]|uniref:hypothetical protein n=1 Tax=Actinoplanes sp. HUAS TT8 TaxID=3447453 RepID=UPI003F526EF9